MIITIIIIAIIKVLFLMIYTNNVTVKYYGGSNRFFIVSTNKYNYWLYIPKKDRPMPGIERGSIKTNINK